MPAKSSAGHGCISMELMKLVVPYIAQALSDTVNISFATNSFPDDLKIAKVHPLF